tara:strand:- start:793 stop:993 length:201 start_codon:yes stop_codon:yes gene_type:complete
MSEQGKKKGSEEGSAKTDSEQSTQEVPANAKSEQGNEEYREKMQFTGQWYGMQVAGRNQARAGSNL